jgi:hypothetical protein
MEYPATVECFSLPEAAKALGKAELTLKRWVEDDLVPEPVLKDTTRGYRQYSVGELRVIAQVLVEHEQNYSYYAATHTITKERLYQAVFGYRVHSI